MGELGAGFSGNCLKGGRGLVAFDKSFDDENVMTPGNEWKGLVREMLRSVFCVPKRGVRGMKPFIDRITGIFLVDGKIWVRVFEIRETEASKSKPEEDATEGTEEGAKKQKKEKKSKKDRSPEISLVEIGPRFVLTPIVMLEGSFGGPVIYENKEYVTPNQVRREIRMKKAARYVSRRSGQQDRISKKTELGLRTDAGHENRKKDVLDSRVLFA
jgi:ribosome biogenesis protein BRX1